jgi:hypothetical protein
LVGAANFAIDIEHHGVVPTEYSLFLPSFPIIDMADDTQQDYCQHRSARFVVCHNSQILPVCMVSFQVQKVLPAPSFLLCKLSR